MLTKRPFLKDSGISEALKAREADKLAALESSTSMVGEEGEGDHYQLMLKHKKMSSILQKALRDAGYEDLAKQMTFRKVSEES
jgi:hypothetical protein